MKYESEIIKEIVDTRGHKLSSLHYQSECVEKWIEEAITQNLASFTEE